jgi:hypothetical protein
MDDEEEQERPQIEYVSDDPAYEEDDFAALDDVDDYDDITKGEGDGWPLSPEDNPN